ncbi:MAG: Phage related lysozyme [Candidatus Tokpelaia hoelldobleri]|uniref:Lysozyme n=1 Tax=Candidatus Tokpelaia hoelldobleri TaxID=1902579 RepID=A0A1U9JSH0_9HYPH|nr:MAG: Phage related lysozyme [Candidatus Tokpelaia hoelldoblerii]
MFDDNNEQWPNRWKKQEQDKALSAFLRGRGKNTLLRLSADALGIPLIDEQQQMPQGLQASGFAPVNEPAGMPENQGRRQSSLSLVVQDEPDHGFQGNAYGQPGNKGGLRAAFEALGDDPRLRQPGYMRRMGGTVGAGWGEDIPDRQGAEYIQSQREFPTFRESAIFPRFETPVLSLLTERRPNSLSFDTSAPMIQQAVFQPQQQQPLYTQNTIFDEEHLPSPQLMMEQDFSQMPYEYGKNGSDVKFGGEKISLGDFGFVPNPEAREEAQVIAIMDEKAIDNNPEKYNGKDTQNTVDWLPKYEPYSGHAHGSGNSDYSPKQGNFNNSAGSEEVGKPTENISKWMKCVEGYSSKGYADGAKGRVSAGYGRNMHKSQMPSFVSRNLANKWLDEDINKAYVAVDELVKVPMTSNERDALASFVYNGGPGMLQKSSVLREFNRGNKQGAIEAWHQYNVGTIDGVKQKIPALSRRREAEINMFQNGEYICPKYGK